MVKIDIRWSDIDANRHVANSAYVNFMSHARLQYMKAAGITQEKLETYHLGPVAFYENIFYLKEIRPEETVYVSVQLKGMSENGTFFEFIHQIYNEEGEHKASCEMMGAWINMETRKLTPLPKPLSEHFGMFDKTEDFRVLTKEDTRKFNVRPHNIPKEQLQAQLEKPQLL